MGTGQHGNRAPSPVVRPAAWLLLLPDLLLPSACARAQAPASDPTAPGSAPTAAGFRQTVLVRALEHPWGMA